MIPHWQNMMCRGAKGAGAAAAFPVYAVSQHVAWVSNFYYAFSVTFPVSDAFLGWAKAKLQKLKKH